MAKLEGRNPWTDTRAHDLLLNFLLCYCLYDTWCIHILLVYFFLPLEFFCLFSNFSVPSSVFECRFIILPPSADSLFFPQITPELHFAPYFLMIFFHGVGDTKIINFLEPNSCLLFWLNSLMLFWQTSCFFNQNLFFFFFLCLYFCLSLPFGFST